MRIGPGLLVVALVLTGCAQRYLVPAATDDGEWFGTGSLVFLATPLDGKDARQKRQLGTGELVAGTLAEAVERCGSLVTIGGVFEDRDQARAAARAARAHFLVYPEIERWTDRVDEWTGRGDRITLRIQIFEVSTGKLLDPRRIEASSPRVTVRRHHAVDLLPDLVDQWSRDVCISRP